MCLLVLTGVHSVNHDKDHTRKRKLGGASVLWIYNCWLWDRDPTTSPWVLQITIGCVPFRFTERWWRHPSQCPGIIDQASQSIHGNLTMYPLKNTHWQLQCSFTVHSKWYRTSTVCGHRLTPPHFYRPHFAQSQVRVELSKFRAKKEMGLDHIHPRLLRACAEVFHYLFSLLLKLTRVRQLWKNPCISPVPKAKHPRTLYDYKLLALACHEGLWETGSVLRQLRPMVSSYMDHLQFAYQAIVGVDDLPDATYIPSDTTRESATSRNSLTTPPLLAASARTMTRSIEGWWEALSAGRRRTTSSLTSQKPESCW